MYMRKCRYEEKFENGEQTYTFTGPCVVTGEDYSVTVKGPDLFRYNQGEAIQDAFPYLSAEDREFLISGTSPNGWDELFGGFGDEDDEDDNPTYAEVMQREDGE